MDSGFDIAIIGAGIAGASLGYFLESGARVLLLEAESAPGYHTTGRSAAFWVATYGGRFIEPLTSASKPFFDAPPPGFGDAPLLGPRGGLHLAPPEGADDRDHEAATALEDLEAEFAGSGLRFERYDTATLRVRYPLLRDAWATDAMLEPDSYDIDVARLHAGFLAGMRRRGASQVCDARVTALAHDGAGWRIGTTAGDFRAKTIVNAAGAWGDEIARLAGAKPLGLMPLRRTMVVLATDPPPPADLPVVLDAGGSFYFKPDAGRIWVSPHDEIADVPRDAAPEEIDIAIAVDAFERACKLRVVRVERSWAGLRTFAPDRLPVYGYDAQVPGFFWCVGQGGFGIQTAPAAGALAAALVEQRPAPFGLDAGNYAPTRFTR